MAATKTLPNAVKHDDTSALQLFDDVEAVEKELTDFLTGFLHHVKQLQAQAAARS